MGCLLALGEINAACGRRGKERENHGWVAARMDGGSLGVERRGREGGERARSHRRPYVRRSSSFRM